MFEKEAEEYSRNFDWTNDDRIIDYSERGFQKGAEFGYNKGKEEVKTAILKLRNCMNCKYRDTRCHSSCKDKGIVLCGHWEMKE